MAGIYLNLNHHLNFTDEQQFTALVLCAIAIPVDFILGKLK
jgi:hypothetical protein